MSDIVLLDGGMGQELIHRAGSSPTPLWATQVMIDQPELVRAIHADFFAAGSTIATTNTYAIHRDRFADSEFLNRFQDLYRIAIDAATSARDAQGSGRLAGAIGPLVASYRPDLHPDHDTAVRAYEEVVALLAPGVDLLICETVVSLNHARAILQAAVTAGKPVWLSVSVDDIDGHLLRSGEPVADVIPIAADKAQGILVNCSAPEAIPAALEQLRDCGVPTGAYANGFQKITKEFLGHKPTVDALSARRDFSPATYADHVMKWVNQGATIVGGCCEVGPAHIAEIAERLTGAGHRII